MKIELIAPCVVRPHIFFIPLRFSQLPHRTNSSQSLYEHEEAEEAESAIAALGRHVESEVINSLGANIQTLRAWFTRLSDLNFSNLVWNTPITPTSAKVRLPLIRCNCNITWFFCVDVYSTAMQSQICLEMPRFSKLGRMAGNTSRSKFYYHTPRTRRKPTPRLATCSSYLYFHQLMHQFIAEDPVRVSPPFGFTRNLITDWDGRHSGPKRKRQNWKLDASQYRHRQRNL